MTKLNKECLSCKKYATTLGGTNECLLYNISSKVYDLVKDICVCQKCLVKTMCVNFCDKLHNQTDELVKIYFRDGYYNDDK